LSISEEAIDEIDYHLITNYNQMIITEKTEFNILNHGKAWHYYK